MQLDSSGGDGGSRVRGVDQRSDAAGGIRSISAHNANKLFDIMADQRKRRQTG
jgi:hypothetical protein